jgi:hypothetical protein
MMVKNILPNLKLDSKDKVICSYTISDNIFAKMNTWNNKKTDRKGIKTKWQNGRQWQVIKQKQGLLSGHPHHERDHCVRL